MKSMTGFGEASVENETHRVNVTARSVNQRYLDIVLRLPDELRVQEAALRKKAQDRLERGRVELRVEIEKLGEQPLEVQVDRDALRTLRDAIREVAKEDLLRDELSFGDLLRLPDIVRVRHAEESGSGNDWAIVGQAIDESLDQLVVARQEEGDRLEEILRAKIGELQGTAEQLAERRQENTAETLTELRRRLTELVQEEALSEERMHQEAAFLVEKSDVAEELDRLRVHCDRFLGAMDKTGPVGKKLDFLCQEMGREINTVGSKCRDSEMSRLTIEAKLICEQLREQVQNLE